MKTKKLKSSSKATAKRKKQKAIPLLRKKPSARKTACLFGAMKGSVEFLEDVISPVELTRSILDI